MLWGEARAEEIDVDVDRQLAEILLLLQHFCDPAVVGDWVSLECCQIVTDDGSYVELDEDDSSGSGRQIEGLEVEPVAVLKSESCGLAYWEVLR